VDVGGDCRHWRPRAVRGDAQLEHPASAAAAADLPFRSAGRADAPAAPAPPQFGTSPAAPQPPSDPRHKLHPIQGTRLAIDEHGHLVVQSSPNK